MSSVLKPNEQDDELEAAVEQAIAVCDGDPRAAIRALIVANSLLESEIADLRKAVSHAYTPALCLSEIKSGHIRDAIRRGPGGKEYALPSLRRAIGEHPCPKPSACASHYSSERKISESGVDVPRLRQ